MSDFPESLVHYLAAWNELDTSKVREHLDRSCSPDVLFIDPANTTRNIDELEAMIIKGRVDRPTASYHRVSGVDGHNLRYRYLWEVRIGGDPLLPGMDVTTVNEEGKILQIDGFFGPFPELEA
ncbi:nuclear transport factor 2 family protein [Pseudomaricurvus alkylphenolicus]|uniref:nuclear transport factor 2 family protein n=1 Tax=Pseudomaricurvus alkylphenolicus TaxID=1306991 RepID=UPI0014214708|nr:nuclear transport factor 2 family protein [Pseudomaricurvus alkylphenolicus]NIB39839.1 nuclear transport factor 2 family protein [Pseudomaricurvus alkylphenolicus]